MMSKRVLSSLAVLFVLLRADDALQVLAILQQRVGEICEAAALRQA